MAEELFSPARRVDGFISAAHLLPLDSLAAASCSPPSVLAARFAYFFGEREKQLLFKHVEAIQNGRDGEKGC